MTLRKHSERRVEARDPKALASRCGKRQLGDYSASMGKTVNINRFSLRE